MSSEVFNSRLLGIPGRGILTKKANLLQGDSTNYFEKLNIPVGCPSLPLSWGLTLIGV
jgi:hypothetical protein